MYLEPGERIFLLTSKVAGDTDYTHVIEIEIPVVSVSGRQYHNPQAGHIVHARQCPALELNDCLNLTCDGDNLLNAYARANETRLGNDPDHAFVANPLGGAE